MHMQPIKTGLAVGFFFAVVHLGWALLVMLGWGQDVVNFIYQLHMIEPAHTVGRFNLATVLTLIVVTAAIGFAVGFVFARIWNRVGRS